MELKNLTVSDFAAITASDAPAPGGGSVSALCGALAASLAEMVANLTSGREKYAQVQPQVEEVLQQYPAIRARLLDAIDRDSKAFDLYMAALAMPKTTDAEKAARKRAMQEGLKAAALVPMETAETALTVFPALRLAVEQGNANAITDGMVGTMLARTGRPGRGVQCARQPLLHPGFRLYRSTDPPRRSGAIRRHCLGAIHSGQGLSGRRSVKIALPMASQRGRGQGQIARRLSRILPRIYPPGNVEKGPPMRFSARFSFSNRSFDFIVGFDRCFSFKKNRKNQNSS